MKRVLFFIGLFLPAVGAESSGNLADDMHSDLLGLFYGEIYAGPADDLFDLGTESITPNLHYSKPDLKPVAIKKKSTIFKCPFESCDREFLYEASCYNHLENDHYYVCLAQEGYNCQFCSYSTLNKRSFDYHIKKHMIDNFYKCDYENCDYKTLEQANLKRHQSVHIKKSYECKICDKKFVRGSYLIHSRTKKHKRAAEMLGENDLGEL
ncbi:hypothetical protein A3F66_02555 [candidate division TM6 bacterium RIFCSPHIGHO2_12_FULL_32_22]|nr:MAG: hypothetical protein A3F66_02555 [candidate division TM6 bacterium RIFCSPHIGHO2_12_FULL_32_22]